jgi:hypothetical protein
MTDYLRSFIALAQVRALVMTLSRAETGLYCSRMAQKVNDDDAHLKKSSESAEISIERGHGEV